MKSHVHHFLLGKGDHIMPLLFFPSKVAQESLWWKNMDKTKKNREKGAMDSQLDKHTLEWVNLMCWCRWKIG